MVAESERTRKRGSGTIGKGKRLISLAFKFVGTAMRELCMGLLGKGIKYKGRRRDDALSRLIDSLPSNMDNKKKEMDGEKSFNAKGPSPKFIPSNLYRKEARLYMGTGTGGGGVERLPLTVGGGSFSLSKSRVT
ncbi:hypothetical protein OUZ56_007671 [Daphnia magna]|uniref:Uncharacterized protein n=1 Tax=Daphnia magna TaxID=35525 RepID=A0ABR0AAN9_9CRUS|nr:hypothetical protein OUZ56_007671 [Daphnia magna]